MNDAMDGGNDDQNMDALQRSQPALGMAAVGDEASSFQHNWRDHGNLVDNRLDDDDEDNWSRQVETDESSVVHHPTGMGGGGGGESLLHYADDSVAHLGSVVEEGDNDALVATGDRGEEEEDDDDVDDTSSSAQRAAPPPPSHPELTLKERLVLRERQRRIETERARWKRQFALNNGGGDSVGDDGVGGGGGVIDGDRDSDDNRDGDRDDDLQRGAGADGLEGGHGDDAASSSVMMGGGGHVSGGGGGGGGSATEGTLGEESTRAHPDHDHPSNQETLGFNMERFLRNSVTFDPQLDTAGTGATAGGSGDNGPPPLLERFLNEPVVIEPPGEGGASDSHPRSFDGSDRDGADGASMVPDDDGDVPPEAPVPPESFVSFGDGTNASTNASVVVEADEEDVARDPLTPLASMDAQDASSILAHGIGGIGEDDEDSPRLDEPRVLRLTEADMQEMAAIEEASIGNAPPSEREEETLSDIGELADFGGGGGQVLRDPSGNFSQGTATTAVESASLVSAGNHSAPQASSSGHPDAQNLDGFLNQLDEETHPDGLPVVVSAAAEGSGDNLYESAAARMPPTIGDPDRRSEDDCRTSPLLTNRVLRPGMVAIPPHLGLSAARFGGPHEALVVDGFDFDKDAPTSPLPSARGDDSFRDLPMDVWSPPGKMHVSPISFKGVRALPSTDEEETPAIPYMEADARVPGPPPAVVGGDGGRMFRAVSAPTPVAPDEGTPLLIDFPPDIRSSLRESTRSRRFSIVSIGSIFSDVRSEEDGSKEEIQNESEFYLRSSILSRAFPERMFALTVTLIFEIPVLLMISGGSDALCELVGRSRYQLLMGFIPLTSAISGNVGLQASTLTTRAISHCHVTPDSYVPWFLQEIGAACVLGVGMGILLGSVAFFASGMDVAFGLTILFAQFISIVTAGCTGTFAPLLFSFIFRRDSGKWGGPLETAIQDIVGSFAMVIISYHILKFLGPGPIDANDVCAPGQSDDLS